jgi:hypothetical protein
MSYILMEVGYEYNDETYNWSEGGTPIKSFDSKELAEAECLTRNIETYRKGGPYGGGLGLYDEDFTHDYHDKHEYSNLHHVTKDTSDDDIKDLIKRTGLVFYEVKEVPNG